MGRIKSILLFTDLEGTLLRESDGQYDEAEMSKFLLMIDKLQKETGMMVDIHIVSPMLPEMMKRILDRIDKSIYNFNSSAHRVSAICGATASPETKPDECYLIDKRIMPLPKSYSSITDATYGKLNYVKEWINAMQLKERFGMAIYCGNGRNDIEAMKFIKAQAKGYVVCPKNSRTEIKGFADYLSTEEDLPGVTEGIDDIIKKITKKEKKVEDDLEK